MCLFDGAAHAHTHMLSAVTKANVEQSQRCFISPIHCFILANATPLHSFSHSLALSSRCLNGHAVTKSC